MALRRGQGHEQLKELAKVWHGAAHVAGSAATNALIVPHTDDLGERDRAQYDLGQATMALLIAAADLGIGSGHSVVADEDQARSVLGFADDRYTAYLIDRGYPADRLLKAFRNPNRRPFTEVVHRSLVAGTAQQGANLRQRAVSSSQGSRALKADAIHAQTG